MLFSWSYLTVVALCFALSTVQAITEEEKGKIDDIIEQYLNCSNLEGPRSPGLILSFVQNGEVQIAKGYGKALLETDVDVTTNTKFPLASVSKHITAALLGMLLEKDGRYTMDTPVRTILGDWFHFSNGFRSNNTNLRDLLAHKTGLDRNDDLWMFDVFTLEDMIQRIRFFDTYEPFREEFVYNNMMYGLCGAIATALDEQHRSYEDLIREYIFDELGMTESMFFLDVNEDFDGFAAPYIYLDGLSVRLPRAAFHGNEGISAAGNIASTAVDMTKWLQFLLDVQKPGSNRTDVNQIFTPEMVTKYGGQFAKPKDKETINFGTMYGRGLHLAKYKGYDVQNHAGFMWGYNTRLNVLPALDMGIFIAINGLGIPNDLGLLTTYITDLVIGDEPWIDGDMICSYKRPREDDLERSLVVQEELVRSMLKTTLPKPEDYIHKTVPERPLGDYAGMYGNLAMGNMTVEYVEAEEQLVLYYGRTHSWYLIHEQDNLFMTVGTAVPAIYVPSFSVLFSSSDPDEAILDGLSLPDRDPKPISFERNLKLSDAPPPDLGSCEGP